MVRLTIKKEDKWITGSRKILIILKKMGNSIGGKGITWFSTAWRNKMMYIETDIIYNETV